METYKIERTDDAPIPRNERHEYPYKELAVGESFYVPELWRRNSVNACVRRWQRLNAGVRFAIKSDGDGFRVWRVG